MYLDDIVINPSSFTGWLFTFWYLELTFCLSVCPAVLLVHVIVCFWIFASKCSFKYVGFIELNQSWKWCAHTHTHTTLYMVIKHQLIWECFCHQLINANGIHIFCYSVLMPEGSLDCSSTITSWNQMPVKAKRSLIMCLNSFGDCWAHLAPKWLQN